MLLSMVNDHFTTFEATKACDRVIHVKQFNLLMDKGLPASLSWSKSVLKPVVAHSQCPCLSSALSTLLTYRMFFLVALFVALL